MKGNYEYIGQPLEVGAAKALIVELFAGKSAHRKEISEKVSDTHIKRKGKPSEATTTNPVSDALQQLKEELLANLLGAGIWAIIAVIGKGAEAVYVYYYPTYRSYAESQGMNIWACKVGHTTDDLHKRIKSQSRTAMPEHPKVELIIHTDRSQILEKAIHNILKFQDKFMENAPGKEWFMTTPNEVKQIYNCILKKGIKQT